MTQLWRALEPLWQWNTTSSWLLAVLLLYLFVRVILAIAKRWWKMEGLVEVHERRLDKMDKKLDSVIEGLANLRNDMNRRFLEAGHKPPAQSKSPLGLTEFGKEIRDKLDAPGVVLAALGKIQKRIDALQPTSAYELQEGCLSKLRWEKILDPETNRKVDDLAYQKGTHRDIILAVLALEARDLLLPQYGWGEEVASGGGGPRGGV